MVGPIPNKISVRNYLVKYRINPFFMEWGAAQVKMEKDCIEPIVY